MNILHTRPSRYLTMESLDLPRELEPTSPPSLMVSELCGSIAPANWFYDENFANGFTTLNYDETETESETELKPTLELLNNEELVVEIMGFDDEECLLDQKLPFFIEYESTNLQTTISDELAQSMSLQPTNKVQPILAEQQHEQYETAAVLAQLTPPQSPPQSTGYLHRGVKEEERKALSFATDATSTLPTATPYTFNNWAGIQLNQFESSHNEIERESQLVDDIVKSRMQELQLPSWVQDTTDDSESQLSSAASFFCIGRNDEEWLPESNGSSPHYASSQAGSSSSSSSSSSFIEELETSAPASPVDGSEISSSVRTSTKKRTRTYGRGVEDRKIRKKEQNKNAATRYRQKKKLEMEHVLNEEQELAQQNALLKCTLAERQHERRYLRQLIREFHQGRKPC